MDDNSLGAIADSIVDDGAPAAAGGAQVETGADGAAAGADSGVVELDAAAEAGRAEADAAAAAAGEAGEDDGEFELEIDGQVETLTGQQLIELVQQARAGVAAGDVDEKVRTQVETATQKMFADNAAGLEKVGQATINRLNHMQSLVNALLPEEPDISLLRSDPDSYHEQLALFKQFSGVRAQIDAALNEENQKLGMIRGQSESLSAAERNQLLQDERAKLVEALPEMADPAKATAFIAAGRDFAKTLGFSPEEYDAVTDHRIFRLLKLAMDGKAAPVAKEQQKNAIRRRIAEKPPVARTAGGQFTGNHRLRSRRKSASTIAAVGSRTSRR